MKLRKAICVLVVTGAGFLAPAAFGCGFEDPAAMPTGILNWIYPKTLHINTAVWQAQLDAKIGKDPPLQTTNKLLVNPGYRKAIRTLRDFSDGLAGRSEAKSQNSFVVLLMEAMLWSRVSIADGQSILVPHVKAADEGEAIIITQRVVLEAINQGRLTPRAANELGLMRFYGNDDAIARAMAIMDGASVNASRINQ